MERLSPTDPELTREALAQYHAQHGNEVPWGIVFSLDVGVALEDMPYYVLWLKPRQPTEAELKWGREQVEKFKRARA